jgi:Fe-S cluster assembly protein SufD
LKTEIEQAYLHDFAEIKRAPAIQGNGGGWLQRIRQNAFDRFQELGFPTTRQEEWRFTDVSPIARRRFEPAGGGKRAKSEDIAAFSLARQGAHELVFLNGVYDERLSSPGVLPEGVELASLGGELADGATRIEPYLTRYADYQERAFPALNTAFLRDGAFVRIAPGVVIEHPIHLLFIVTESDEPQVIHPRNLIIAGANSQAMIVENYVGLDSGVYFTNAVTEMVLGEYSVVEHYKVERESEKAYHVATVQAQQGASSSLVSYVLTLSGRLVRNDINVILEAEGCTCTLNGLYVTKGRQHVDNHTTIDHARPHCSSRELFKGILDDKSRAVFNGRVIVRPNAQKTDSQQTNKNLILSDNTDVNAKPELEIFANDVKCAHGATVGRLDEQAIFYLRSRGIDEQTASRLLTYAFASEVTKQIRVRGLRSQIEEILSAQLPVHDRMLEAV